MSLTRLAANAKAANDKRKKIPKVQQRAATKRSTINQENYSFDFTINYRDIEKFSLCKKFLSLEVGKTYGECSSIIDYGEHFNFPEPIAPTQEDFEDEVKGILVKLQYQTQYSNWYKRISE